MSRIPFKDKLELLTDELQQTVRTLIYHKGEESKDYNHKCLHPDDDFQFNIPDGSHWVVEITADNVFDEHGNQYNFDVLGMSELCSIVDHLLEKYSK